MEDLGYLASSEATVLPVECSVARLGEFPVECSVACLGEFPVVRLVESSEESPEVLPEEFLAEPLVVLDRGYR